MLTGVLIVRLLYDIEVEYEEHDSHIWHLRVPLETVRIILL